MIMQRERTAVINWASSMIDRADVLFLDTETTGLNSSAEIVEIAVVDGLGRTLLDTLVRPRRPIPSDAIAIHGITNAMVASAPSWVDVYPALSAMLGDAHSVVIYNADFDLRMLSQTNHPYRFPLPAVHYDCAMKQFAAFRGVWNARYKAYRWHSLTDAARFLQVRMDGPHRAANDTRLCRLVVQAMARASADPPKG